MTFILKRLPIIIWVAVFIVIHQSEAVYQFAFPPTIFPAHQPLFGQVVDAILYGVIAAPFMLLFYLLGKLLVGIFGAGIAQLWQMPSDSQTIDKAWSTALVFGSMFYGSLLYWSWYFQYKCPECSSIRRKFIGNRDESRSSTSPDTIVTKRYNADGDYIGYHETEVGQSTVSWTTKVRRYKCLACGSEWSKD